MARIYSQILFRISLLEGLVEKFDVSSIICGKGTSTLEASQLDALFQILRYWLIDELWNALRHALLGSALSNLHNFFHYLWDGDVDTLDGSLLHSFTRVLFLCWSNHLDLIVGRADAVITFATCATIPGTWPCRKRHVLADVNVAHQVAREKRGLRSLEQHFRVTEAFDANSETVDVWWSNHLELRDSVNLILKKLQLLNYSSPL